MAKSYLRGHEIEYVDNNWRYSDTKHLTASTYKDRPCGNCGKEETKEGHDACLGELLNIFNACCGHGEINKAYVHSNNGFYIQGELAIEFIEYNKKHKIV